MKKPQCLYLILLLFFSLSANAQVPTNPIGINPYSLKWNKIKTKKFKVIFPRGLESEGQRVANIAEYLWENDSTSIGKKNKRVTILLQNQTTTPNGFVTVGPFRSELYLTPPQFNLNGASNWLDLLTIHEYRHIQQFANTDRGITKLARLLLGSWTWGGFAGTALPRWFWEGDATLMETAFSNSGRGRLPEFDMEYRSVILSGKKYGYEKASATSLKDYVPNHYNLGYYMIAYGRRNFGRDIWADVLEDAVKYKGLLYPLSRNLRKRTGLRTPELYRKTFVELESVWKDEMKDLEDELSEAELINTKPKKRFTDYNNAQFLESGELIVEKSSFAEIRSLYKIDTTGQEKKLRVLGINSLRNRTLSTANGRVCWAERSADARWGNKNYSIIKAYNLYTEELQKLTSKTRYFAPVLSHDGQRIAVIEVTEGLKVSLVILDSFSGKITKKIPSPNNYMWTFPKWTDDDTAVVLVERRKEHNLIQRIRVEGGKIESLTKPTSHQLTNPFPKGDYVFFAGAYTGINNIFAVREGSKQLFQVTSSKFGAFQPAVSADGKVLAYSDFSAMGYDLKTAEIKPETWSTYEEAKPSTIQYFRPIALQEGGSILDKVPEKDFAVTKFNKWSGLLYPHSLLPFVFPPEYGLRILADNKFSTLSAEGSVLYNENEGRTSYSANLSYAELYPVINVGFRQSRRSRVNSFIRQLDANRVQINLYTPDWTESDISVGLELPINYQQGSFFNRLRLIANYHFVNVRNIDRAFPDETIGVLRPLMQEENFNTIDLRFRMSNLQTRALQNINPKWGLVWDAWYRSTVGGSINSGSVFLGRFDIYVPGLFKNHSFFINTAYQSEAFIDNYKFGNFFFYSRGYGAFISDNVFKVGLNYTLPLLYPDLPIWSFLFIKRIKANLFYDYTSLQLSSWEPFPAFNNTMSSLGAELTFDVRAFRLLEVDLGVRYSYLLDANLAPRNGIHQFDFLLFRIGI